MGHVLFHLFAHYSPKMIEKNPSIATEFCPSESWLTNSIQRNVLQKVTVAKLVKKFHAFYGNRKLITVFFTGPDPQPVVADHLHL